MDGLEGADATPVEATDQSAAAPEVTPEVESFTGLDPNEAPEGGHTPEWLQERYKQMQGDYTRKTQELSETASSRAEELEFLESLRSDPDTQRAVLEELQALLDGESDGEEVVDDSEAHDPFEERLNQLEQERATEKAQALGQQIFTHIEQLAKDANLDLDVEEFQTIFEKALAGERIGKDVTETAFKEYQSRETAKHDKWQRAYLASKSASQQVPAGQTANESPNLNDTATRRARFAAILSGE